MNHRLHGADLSPMHPNVACTHTVLFHGFSQPDTQAVHPSLPYAVCGMDNNGVVLAGAEAVPF